jgi:hypothetical protein
MANLSCFVTKALLQAAWWHIGSETQSRRTILTQDIFDQWMIEQRIRYASPHFKNCHYWLDDRGFP